MAKYYLYQHIRPDKNEIFYIGIGTKSYGQNDYERAFRFRNKRDRNPIWFKIFEKCNKQVCVSIIEESDDIEYIKSREIELIAKYGKIIDEKGPLANIQDGGERRSGKITKIVQYDLYGSFLKLFSNVYEASMEVRCSVKNIYNCCEKKSGSARGYLWRYKTSNYEDNIGKYSTARTKAVYQFNKNKELIKEYITPEAASIDTGIDSGSIKKVCYGQRALAGDYFWSYESDGNNFKELNNNIKVQQLDMQGNLIITHKSIKAAADSLGKTSSNAIRNCFIGIQKQAYGFLWKKEE